jgi:Na+/H+-translocating membrane pyrophosphatase
MSTTISTSSNTTTAPVTPGALVPFSVGGVVGLGVAWLVVLILFLVWLVTMRKRFKQVTKEDLLEEQLSSLPLDAETIELQNHVSAPEEKLLGDR